MGNVINLNRVRKRRGREASAKQADESRLRFGQTKSERIKEQDRRKRAKEHLDQRRLEGEEQQ